MTRVVSNDPLDEERFGFQETKAGLVQISVAGRIVARLSGKEASRFLNRVSSLDSRDQQLLMAKATGHFKHGTERASKVRRE